MSIIEAVVLGGLFLLGLFGFLVFDWINTTCMNCGTRAPFLHGLWNGWTCTKCGLTCDRNGERRHG